MGVSLDYLETPASKAHTAQYLPKNQNELPKRTMNDSFTSALIPLSTDLKLREQYLSFMGHVRYGRLLEDMDIFAVMVAQNHIKNPKVPPGGVSPYTLVTVLVDSIEFTSYVVKVSRINSLFLTQMPDILAWFGHSFVRACKLGGKVVYRDRSLARAKVGGNLGENNKSAISHGSERSYKSSSRYR